MSGPAPRFREIFCEFSEGLPRQGPGKRACAACALGLCRDLPRSPAVLDLGCGVGGQTLHLVALLPGAVVSAMDSHAPSIARLRATVAERGLGERVRARVGDLAEPGRRWREPGLLRARGVSGRGGRPGRQRAGDAGGGAGVARRSCEARGAGEGGTVRRWRKH